MTAWLIFAAAAAAVAAIVGVPLYAISAHLQHIASELTAQNRHYGIRHAADGRYADSAVDRPTPGGLRL